MSYDKWTPMNITAGIAFIVVVLVCIHHQTIQRASTQSDQGILLVLKEACESSVAASNTLNPILSLMSVVRACAMLDTVRKLCTCQGIGTLRVEFQTTYDIIQKQKETLLKNVLEAAPSLRYNTVLQHIPVE